MMKAPYSFPARSRADMVSAIESIGHRRYYDHAAWPFCWNAKLDFYPLPSTAAELNPTEGADGEPLDPALDDLWQVRLEASESLFWDVASDMARPYLEGEYSTYPGDDSGAFKFALMGRCGGWLVLTEAFGFRLAGLEPADLIGPDSEWSFPEVRRLYRALVCMDSDFARPKLRQEYAYQLAWHRGQWEAEIREGRAALAETISGNRVRLRALATELREAGGRIPSAVESAARGEVARLAQETREAVAALHPGLREAS